MKNGDFPWFFVCLPGRVAVFRSWPGATISGGSPTRPLFVGGSRGSHWDWVKIMTSHWFLGLFWHAHTRTHTHRHGGFLFLGVPPVIIYFRWGFSHRNDPAIGYPQPFMKPPCQDSWTTRATQHTLVMLDSHFCPMSQDMAGVWNWWIYHPMVILHRNKYGTVKGWFTINFFPLIVQTNPHWECQKWTRQPFSSGAKAQQTASELELKWGPQWGGWLRCTEIPSPHFMDAPDPLGMMSFGWILWSQWHLTHTHILVCFSEHQLQLILHEFPLEQPNCTNPKNP